MFETYNYFKQHNDNKEILNFKEFYRKFSNEREFGGEFSNYDHLVSHRFVGTLQPIYDSVIRGMPKSILDVGCGNGVNLPISKIFPVDYHGLDYAEKTIAVARKSYPNVTFHVGDAFNMEFDDSIFDMLILSLVLVLYKDKDDQLALIKECMRVLKPGGVLVLVMLNSSPFFHLSVVLSRWFGKLLGESLPRDFNCIHMSQREIGKLIRDAGYAVSESVLCGHMHGVLESVRYLNFSKYRRNFGVSESEIFKRPQKIWEDLAMQAGRGKSITGIFYLMSKLFPSLFAYYSVSFIVKD